MNCTRDGCEEVNDVCTHAPTNAVCDDGQFCNGEETCTANGCLLGTAPNCDDGVDCTVDACPSPIDACTHVADSASCNDGNPCTDDICSPATGGPGTGCVFVNNNLPCSDNNSCTTEDACDGGECVGGPPRDCTDVLFCTLDTCDPATGLCVHPSNLCSDGDGCTVDSCDEAGGACGHTYACAHICNPGEITIPDSGPATPYPSTINISGVGGTFTLVSVELLGLSHTFPSDIDILLTAPNTASNAIVMSEVGGSADVIAVDLTLTDGAPPMPPTGPLATGVYSPTNIFPGGEVWPAPAPVPSGGSALSQFDGTDPNGSWNLYVLDVAAADVGSFAGGWCLNYRTTCQTADQCDDGNPCTNDRCDPVLGCVHLNNTDQCTDGNACTVDDTCDGGTCIPGAARSCNDGNACNGIEICDPASGCVAGTPLACDDGDVCNGVETCNPANGCAPGTPPSCNDNNPCTDDSCAAQNGCVYAPDDTNVCSDDNRCNGAETCARSVCQPGTPPNCNDDNACTQDSCDPQTGCMNPPVPADTACPGTNLCLGTGTCDGSGLCVCQCAAALQITTAPEASCGETIVRVNYKSGCDLRGFDFTLAVLPDALMLPAQPPNACATPFLDFQCAVQSVGPGDANARAIILSPNSLATIPGSSSFMELAEIRFVGTAACVDCQTAIGLTSTDSIAADASNAPVPVIEAAGATGSFFTPCPCAESKGDVDCAQDFCTLFDLIATVDQILRVSPSTCEANVAGTACNDVVDVFDLVCLLDCAFALDTPCGRREFCAGGTLPSGCTPVAVAASGRSTLGKSTQPTIGPEARIQPSGDEGLPGSAVVSVVGSRLWGSQPRISDVNVEDATRGIRGLSFTFEVPLGWVTTEVEALGIPTTFQPRFHQNEQELRVIVLSMTGAVIPTGSGPMIRVHLDRTTSALQRGSQVLKVVSAEAADEHGQPFALDVTVGSLGDRTPRAKPVSDPLVP